MSTTDRCFLLCAADKLSRITQPRPKIIAVAGGSASGKTTIADSMVRRVLDRGGHAVIISQDEFKIGQACPANHTSPYRCDDPANYRFDEYEQALLTVASGKPYEFAAYSPDTHMADAPTTLNAAGVAPQLVVSEGIHAWRHNPELFDERIFVDTPLWHRMYLRLYRSFATATDSAQYRQDVMMLFGPLLRAHIDLLQPLKTSATSVVSGSRMIVPVAQFRGRLGECRHDHLYADDKLHVQIHDRQLQFLTPAGAMLVAIELDDELVGHIMQGLAYIRQAESHTVEEPIVTPVAARLQPLKS